MAQQQYHVLVTGFELNKKERNGQTELRHYRYDSDVFSLDESKSGLSYIVKNGNQIVSRFPTSRTMVLLEDVKERQ